MENCAGCGKPIHRDEPVSASFSQEGQRSFFHKTCEDRAEHVNKWKEEASFEHVSDSFFKEGINRIRELKFADPKSLYRVCVQFFFPWRFPGGWADD